MNAQTEQVIYWKQQADHWKAAYDLLAEQHDKAVEALRFYGNPQHWLACNYKILNESPDYLWVGSEGDAHPSLMAQAVLAAIDHEEKSDG